MSGNEFLNPALLAAYENAERINQMVNPALLAAYENAERINQMVNPALLAAYENAERINQIVNPALLAAQESAARAEKALKPFLSATYENAVRAEKVLNSTLFAAQESAARAEEALRPFLSAIHETARMNEVVNSALSAIHESPVMKAMREFSNLPFSLVVRDRVFTELDSLRIDQFDLPEDQDIDQSIQAEIQKELAGNRDYNRLSKKAQSLLLYIYHKVFIPFIISSLVTIIWQKETVQISLEKKETPTEIKSYVRQPIPGINKNLLKGYRVVTGSDVHLRKDPNMKSDIITTLPRGKLLEVLDKSNRSWIFVKVEIEEEIFVGWVSRRYTTYFK